jgi:hypothetical protein
MSKEAPAWVGAVMRRTPAKIKGGGEVQAFEGDLAPAGAPPDANRWPVAPILKIARIFLTPP